MNEQMPPAFTLKMFWIDFNLELQNFGVNSVDLIYFFKINIENDDLMLQTFTLIPSIQNAKVSL